GIDAITLVGATVGAIDAGDGDNMVALHGGDASSVTTGTGADNITLAGATISGAINAGDGNNIVALGSGRAGSVTTGAGMDEITLDGASISGVGAGAGAINSGAGNDRIELA